MNCLTCDTPLPTDDYGYVHGLRKYCSINCRPKPPRKIEIPTACGYCNAPLNQSRKGGYPKHHCNRLCSNRARALRLKESRQKNLICIECNNSFRAAGDKRKYCTQECRIKNQRKRQLQESREYFANLYPNGIKHKICRWCSQPMEVSAKRSYSGRLYHPDCSKEAEKARYRMKVVKRQKQLNPQRISHEQVVREYGSDCHICNEPIDLTLSRTSKLGLTVDHLIPLSRGGTDTLDNLRPAHWTCNRRKSDKLMEELSA